MDINNALYLNEEGKPGGLLYYLLMDIRMPEMDGLEAARLMTY